MQHRHRNPGSRIRASCAAREPIAARERRFADEAFAQRTHPPLDENLHRRLSVFAHWLGVAAAALAVVHGLTDCASTVPTGATIAVTRSAANATIPSQRIAANRKPGDAETTTFWHVYSANGSTLRGFRFGSAGRVSAVCTLKTGFSSSPGADKNGDVMVPWGDVGNGLTLYRGPEMCGAKIGSVEWPIDDFGYPVDAASLNVLTGKIVVALTAPFSLPGGVLVCRISGLCSEIFGGGSSSLNYATAVAIDSGGDCWAVAEFVNLGFGRLKPSALVLSPLRKSGRESLRDGGTPRAAGSMSTNAEMFSRSRTDRRRNCTSTVAANHGACASAGRLRCCTAQCTVASAATMRCLRPRARGSSTSIGTARRR